MIEVVEFTTTALAAPAGFIDNGLFADEGVERQHLDGGTLMAAVGGSVPG